MKISNGLLDLLVYVDSECLVANCVLSLKPIRASEKSLQLNRAAKQAHGHGILVQEATWPLCHPSSGISEPFVS